MRREALLLLTFSTGVIDAMSYLGLGHIFTANMTGNVVFLGFAVAGVPGLSVTRSMLSLAAFLAGAVLGGRLARRTGDSNENRWLAAAFMWEGGLLLLAAMTSMWNGELRAHESSAIYALIVITAAAMGVRNSTVRKLAVPDLTTTVLTMTVTGLAAESSLAGGINTRWATRLMATITLFAGAAIGALLLKQALTAPILLSSVIAFGCAAMMYLSPTPAATVSKVLLED
jgi:uncharacterized membrane protein YoaK (UPF0700 family)